MRAERVLKLPIVVTAQQMADIDRYTIETLGVPGMVLMENAGVCVVREICALIGDVRDRRILVLCGKGNNGGDGFVVARYLRDMGACVSVVLLGERRLLKGDAKHNSDIYEKLGGTVHEIKAAAELPDTSAFDLIVDALLGTGVQGQLKTPLSDVVRYANAASCPVVAVDLPTGINADTGEVYGECIQATVTVTMAHIKRGLLFYPGRSRAGKVVTAEIGIPRSVAFEKGFNSFLVTAGYVQEVLPVRAGDAYKNRCGQVLLLAGSVGMTGAAALSAEAVLRSGAGMAILGIPESLNSILEAKLTEVMTLPLPETDAQSLAAEAASKLTEKLTWANVLAVGPGLTTHTETRKLVFDLLGRTQKTVVLDADGLNCFQGEADLLKAFPAELILTPHPGELARLLDCDACDILARPVDYAARAADELQAVVVLKTAPTVVAAPDGSTFINTSGNPGMATAGMGDVLTGVIAGLAAQQMSPLQAAVAGVYLHGLAGDLAKESLGEYGLLAGDVLRQVPQAIKQTREAKSS